MMRRAAYFLYGVLNYVVFLGVFLYLVGFLLELGVPKTIDSGDPGSLGLALFVNISLLGLFGLQHSVMARPGFKAWWTKIVPEPLERSTYVLLSNALVILLSLFWRPMPTPVWVVESSLGVIAVNTLFASGVGLLLYSSFLIDHFDLFGLRQVYLELRQRPYQGKPFGTPALYRALRHPIYLGWIIMFWATPSMTYGHLLFAGIWTAYILIAIPFEDRDLLDHFGDTHRSWSDRTHALIPLLGRRRS